MKSDYLISVIVLVYNQENYVRKCIESIINQTYRNLQIILVDDKSTDQSGIICDEYALKDNRIQVIHHEHNTGLVGSIKTGLLAAKGDYICEVDGDDWLEDIMYEQLLREIVATDSDFGVTGYVYEGWPEYGRLVVADAKGVFELSDENRYSMIRKYFYRNVIDHCVVKRNMTALWNKMYKAELLFDAYMQLPDCFVEHADTIPLLIIYLKSRRFVMTGGANYHYVKREDSMIQNTDFKRFADRHMGHNELKQILKKYNCYNELIDDENQAHNDWMWALMIKKLGERFQIRSWHVWRFGDIEDLYGKKIVLFGAGGVGRDYYKQISENGHCNIVAWIDSNYEQYHYDYCTVQGIEMLKDIDYDVIVVAVRAENTAYSIISDLHRMGVKAEKIIWKRPQRVCNKMELTEKDSYYE